MMLILPGTADALPAPFVTTVGGVTANYLPGHTAELQVAVPPQHMTMTAEQGWGLATALVTVLVAPLDADQQRARLAAIAAAIAEGGEPR